MPELREAQKEGVAFLTRPNKYGKHTKLLNWGMGTGKTVVIAEALRQLNVKTCLTVSPLSAKSQWGDHYVDWGAFPRRSLIHYPNKHTPVFTRRGVNVVHFHQLYDDDFFINLCRMKFDAVVIDEIHKAKNIDANITHRIFSINKEKNPAKRPLITLAPIQIVASGTPMPNSHMELFPMLKRMCPEAITEEKILERSGKKIKINTGDHEGFGLYYCGGFWDGTGYDFSGATNADELRQRLQDSDFYSHKTLADVWGEVPPVIEYNIDLDLDLSGADFTNTHMSTLRNKIGLAKVTPSARIIKALLDEYPGEKLVVFAFSVEAIEQLVKIFTPIYDAVAYYGALDADEKAISLDAFRFNPACRVIFLQINAAGESINGLQHVCSRAANLEETWTSVERNQALARLLRYGQTKPVFMYNIKASKTMDALMIHKQKVKQGRIDDLFNTQEVGMLEETLEKLVKVGEENARYLVRIATSLEKMAGAGVSLGTNAQIEGIKQEPPKPQDKPAAEKPKDKPKAAEKPKDKPAQTSTAQSAGASDMSVPEDAKDWTMDHLRIVARRNLHRLQSLYEKKKAEDPGLAARTLMGTVISSYKKEDGAPCDELANVTQKDFKAAADAFDALVIPAESASADDDLNL